MKTFNFFEKLWEHSRTLKRVGLVLVMCLITIPQVHAWYVKAFVDGWGGWDTRNIGTGEYTWYNISGGKTFYFIVGDTESNWGTYDIVQNKNTWEDHKSLQASDFGLTSNQMTVALPENSHVTVKYSGSGSDWKVNVYVRPAYYFKYDWNNDGWKWSGWLVRCGDGRYATEGQYKSSCTSFNYDTQDRGSGTGAGSCSNIITDGDNLTSGLKCFFIYNPDGSTRSLTIQEKNSTSGHNYIYFDNTNAGWDDSKIQFVLGHLSYSRTVNMSKVGSSDYTTLYYCDRSSNDWTSDGCFAYFGMIGSSSKFTDGAWASDNMYRASHYSQPLYKHQNLSDGYNYVISKADNVNGHPITIEEKGTGYTSLNYTQTVKYQLSKNGAAYADMSASDGATPATITASSYKLSGGRSSVSSTSLDEALTVNTTTRYSSTITACHTGKTTLTVSNVRPGYQFIGWYEGNTQKSTATSYTYRPTGEATVSARFKKLYAYVEGRFEVRDENGDVLSTASNGDWKTDVRTIPMEYDETNNRFVLHTHSTLTQLKANIGSQGSGKQEPYFFIRTSSSTSSWTDGGQYWAHSEGTDQNLASRGSKKSCDGGSKAFTFTGSEAGYVVLYCDASNVWYDMEYTVDYKKNGGASGADGSVTGTTTDDNSPYLYNTAVTTVSNDYTNTGYKFKWWNTNYGGTGEDFYPGEKFNITANTNLYAQWEEVPSGWAYWNGNTDASSSPLDVTGNGVTMRMTKNSVDYNTGIQGATVVSKYSGTTEKHANVLAMDAADEYLQIHFTDGSPINALQLGTVHNGTSGTKKVVVIYSTTADFSTGEHEEIEVTIPHSYQASKGVTSFSPSTSNKYLYARIYKSVSTAVYSYTGPASDGAGKMRIYSIKAQKGTACGPNGLAYETATVNKTYGDAAFTNTLTNAHSLAVSYSSGDGDVATVSSTGEVTIKGAGSTTITATWDGSVAYCEGTASYTLNVAKASISPSLSYDETTLTAGDDSSSPTITGNLGNGTVTYASDDTDVATVDENTGVVTAVAEGTATITATIAATDNYNGNTTTAEFTINAACSDPTTTFADSYCNIGSTLDLRTLISNSQGDGTITYAVTDAGGTSASIADGYKFSATAVGTATVTATQAADATNGYCEKVMTADIVVDPQPSSSVNFEQMVLDNSKKYSYATALSAAHIAYSVGDNPLDSLDDSKGDRNEPYLGIKLKPANSYIQVVVPRGNTLKVKFGHISEKIAYFIDDEKQDSLATSTTVLEVAADASSSHTYKFQLKTKDKTLVIKQIMIDEAIATVTLPARITMGSTTNGTISVTGTEDGVKVVDVGSTVTVGVSASSGYELTELTYVKTGSGDTPTDITEGDLSEDSYSFYMPNYNVTINATFVSSGFTLTNVVNTVGYGTVSPASVADIPSGTATSTSSNTYAVNGTTVTATPTPATAEYTYAFSSWSGLPATVTENATVTANFTRTPVNYTLTWDLAGGTVSTAGTGADKDATGTPYSSVAYGSSITKPVVTKSGCDFAGWDVTPAATMPAENTTYTAQWATKYTVTFEQTAGYCATKNATGSSVNPITLPTPSGLGVYEFLGWYTSAGTRVGGAGEEYTPTAGITLYAKWQASCSGGGGSTPVVLFSQDFNSATEVPYAAPASGSKERYYLTGGDSVVSNLVGSTKNLFTSIYSKMKKQDIAINSSTAGSSKDASGKFQACGLSDNEAYWRMVRTSNLASTAPTAIKFEMDVEIFYPSASSNPEIFVMIGSGYSDTLTVTYPTAAQTYTGFGIMAGSSSSNPHYICKAETNTKLETTGYIPDATSKHITWIVNNTGESLTYKTPSNNDSTLATGKWTLFVGNRCVLDAQDRTATGASTYSGTTIQNIYIGNVSKKKHHVMIDNVKITDLAPAGSSCYHVTYDGNGATSGFMDNPRQYTSGDYVWIDDMLSYGYEKTGGYEFNGWNTKPDGSGDDYSYNNYPLDHFIITQDTTLYAQWRIIIDENRTNLNGFEDLKHKDVRVTNGATLTLTQDTTVRNMLVETGSTLHVAKTGGGAGVTLTAKSLALQGGYGYVNNAIKYDMPRVYIEDDSKIKRTSNIINFDIAVDNNSYYPFALPFDVPLKVRNGYNHAEDPNIVDYANFTLAYYSNYGQYGQFAVKTYNGQRRANYGSSSANWEHVSSGTTLKAGHGYALTALPAPGYGDFAVIRFPMVAEKEWTSDGEIGHYTDAKSVEHIKDTVHVTAYKKTGTGPGTGDDTPKKNIGWNLLGVPYMACYQTSADMYSGDGAAAIIQGKFDYEENKWDDEDKIRYVTVPKEDFSEYAQYNIVDEGTKLLPGWCFFVQIETSGILKFLSSKEAASSSLVYAPRREKAMPTLKTGIILSGNDANDKTTILVSDKYSAAEYEINADLEKMFGEDSYTLATYSLSGSTRLAFNAMSNADAANIIPIGYRAPADGEYTFSINPRYAENGAFEHVNLIDYETGIVTDLLLYSYTFSTERAQNDARFALNVVPRQDMPTDIENGASDASDIRKMIINDQLYIILNGKMYDATGKAVK